MHTVIVGGGVVGLASAYYLADRGASVTVCEAGSIGGGSTGRSAGGVRAQFSTPVNVDLSRESVRVWESFEAEFGVDIGYRQSGYLFLARDGATADAFREQVTMQNDRGVPSELLSPADLRERWPAIDADQFVAATYCSEDGFADPHLALQGFSTAASEAGAEIRTNAPVTGIDADGAADAGVTVRTPDARIDADYVVNAAGAWAGRVAELAGLDLPVSPRRRQLAVVEPARAVPGTDPLTIDLDRGSYFRPERDGRALVGGHFDDADPDVDPDRYDDSMDLDWAATAVECAADYADYFGPETGVVRGWAGLYAVTPDHHPVMEESAPGVVTAAGFSGHGFQHAPATGQIVADLCLDGETSLVDVSALSSDRFEDGDLVDERNVA
ncbi:FAD-binding oxidoreductase [Halostella sp. JP-L12]|uniref:NAD(P)/FAD-dependent oxidoreductase n=1 Tax=Halostella TaxID=1843185 RepID=UPI000EF7E58E|nr:MULTISPECIES: FAD-dependent oxidoreductase [Halostella]NHN45984.1 FAD-binding oxidoreductase [Halostella sp. JP-L12]